MPKYRVNVRQIETWVAQYEIIADDPEKAKLLIPHLLEIGGPDALPKKGEEQVAIEYADPQTYSVMEAEPLEEMEDAERENNKRLREMKIKPKFETAYNPEVIEFGEYENIGGIVQTKKGKKP